MSGLHRDEGLAAHKRSMAPCSRHGLDDGPGFEWLLGYTAGAA